MDFTALAYPFSLGLVAAFNPCGFALLPAYLSYFIGSEQTRPAGATGTATLAETLRALAVALTLTAGFVAVFGTFGVLFSTVLSQGAVLDRIGYVTIVIGVAITLLGIWMLAGRSVNLRLPKIGGGAEGRGLVSVFVFGVSYAVVSLSCTIGLFIAAVASTFTNDGAADGIADFVAYAIGMGAVMTFLTLALAQARTGVVQAMRKVIRWINPVAGGVLAASGIYLVNYGWWELQVLEDPTASNPVVERFAEFQAEVTGWIDQAGAERLGVLCALGVLGALLLGWRKSETNLSRRRFATEAYAALYLAVEFGFNGGEFVLLPVLRFLAGWPERVVHWFSDPLRFGVPLEAALTAAVIWSRWRALHRRTDPDRSRQP